MFGVIGVSKVFTVHCFVTTVSFGCLFANDLDILNPWPWDLNPCYHHWRSPIPRITMNSFLQQDYSLPLPCLFIHFQRLPDSCQIPQHL